MRHYAQYDENGKLIAVGTGIVGGVEITEAEHNALLSEIREKAALVNRLYGGEITAENVPAEWREEIDRRVAERIAADAEAAAQPISGEEFMDMLGEVL